MSFRVLTVFLATISLAAAEDRMPTPQQWLDRLNHAMKSLNYHGTVVFMKNGQLDTMKYQHDVEKGIEQERLSSLNSPLREVTRKSNEVSCVFKESNQKVINHHPIDSSFIVNLPQDMGNLNDFYSLSLAGQEEVAMQLARIIDIQPRDNLRYARKIWVENQHFLPLKAEAFDESGQIIEQVMFTDLTIDNQNSGNREIADSKLQVKHIHAAEAEPIEHAPFVLHNWPAGFRSVFFIRNSIEQARKPVDHLLISDGFSSVSVYFGPKGDDAVEGLSALGSVHSFSRVIGNFQLTVLGEVPAQTVEYIAAGIALR